MVFLALNLILRLLGNYDTMRVGLLRCLLETKVPKSSDFTADRNLTAF